MNTNDPASPFYIFEGLTPDEIDVFTSYAIEKAIESSTRQDLVMVRFPDVIRTEEERRTEVWREVPGYPRYEVSNLGGFRERTTKRVRKQTVLKTGHRQVTLKNKGEKGKTAYVHQLVARAFKADSRQPNQDMVNHVDGNPANNAATNLEWCTQKENLSHAQGFRGTGEDHPRAVKRSNRVLLGAEEKVIRNYINWLEHCNSGEDEAEAIQGYLNSLRYWDSGEDETEDD